MSDDAGPGERSLTAAYVAYASVGWFLSGIGAALPDLRQALGGWASAYPVLPGAVILASALVAVRRHRRAEPHRAHAEVLRIGAGGLAAGAVVMGVTRWPAIGVLGALGASLGGALLVRYLPGVLATAAPDRPARAIMRANAWSSLGGIASPAVIGLTIAVGIGWMPGMAGPLALGAAVVVASLRRHRPDGPGREGSPAEGNRPAIGSPGDGGIGVLPPLATWWRAWAVLCVGIVVEFCFAYFAATYLHDDIGLSTAMAAACAAVWGIGMTAGRFVVSLRRPPATLAVPIAVLAAGFVLFWGFATPAVAVTGVLVAGLGAAPMYPMRVDALLRHFPHSPDQGSARAGLASGAALVGAPALMIGLRAALGVRRAYLAVPVLLAVLAVLAGVQRDPAR